MILNNELIVPADPVSVYALLQDAERVVHCLPGATLLRTDGDTHEGRVRVKVGPITAIYEGTIRFVASDPTTHRLRLVARGQDAKGNGDAEAAVVIDIEPDGAGSLVTIETDLSIRGRLAQFGQAAIGPVSQRLLKQFETNIGDLVAGVAPASVPVSSSPAQMLSDAPISQTDSTLGTAQPPAWSGRSRTLQPAGTGDLDALSLILGPLGRARAKLVLVAAAGLVTGYVYGRALTVERIYRR